MSYCDTTVNVASHLSFGFLSMTHGSHAAGAEPAPLGDAEYRALAAFRHALRRFLSFSEAAASAQGLTPQQHQALLAVRGAGAGRLTVGRLAELLQIRPHSAVGLVSRLAAQGLVRREEGNEDRRQVLVALTAEAEALLERLSLAHRDELRRLAPTLRALLAQLEAGS
jgi:DNA-binding MarR family transcriptional regulator